MKVISPQPNGALPHRSAQTYTVRPGDSLSAIAKRVLGSEARWNELYQANRHVIGKNPNRINAGMVLTLPGAASTETAVPTPRPADDRSAEPRIAGDSLLLSRRPDPRPENLPGASATRERLGRWTEQDVEFLARAISAEARGEVTKYFETGDRRYRDSVVAIGTVIVNKAEESGTGIERTIRRNPHFLSAWGQGERGHNRRNFREFFRPTHQIAHWAELKQIAREALMGADPTGIDPNHYYDTSISAPRWARGRGVETRRIGSIVFVDNARD